MRSSCVALAAVIVAAVCPARSEASLILFSSRPAWKAMVPGASTVDFEIPPTGGFQFVPSPPGFTASGISFTLVAGSTGNMWLIAPTFYGTPSQVLSSQQSGTGLDGFLITLPAAATAIALDFDTLRCVNEDCLPGETVTFALSTGDSFALTSVSSPDMGFVGLVSSTPITSLSATISGTPGVQNGVLNIDNFSVGEPIPEPSALLLIGSGLSWLALRRRRRTS